MAGQEGKRGSGGTLTVLFLCIALAGVGLGSGFLDTQRTPVEPPHAAPPPPRPKSAQPRPEPEPARPEEDASALPSKPAPTPVEVYDAAWDIVSDNYFDRDFGGIDWEAVHERYRPVAENTDNSVVLYQEAIRPMLAALHTSHLSARLPKDAVSPPGYVAQKENPRRGDTISSSFAGAGDVGGVMVVFDGHQWVVSHVDKGSQAEIAGIGPGTRMASSRITTLDSESPPRYHADLAFIRRDGGTERLSYDYASDKYGPQREARTLGSGVRLVRFDTFDKESVDWAINEIRLAAPPGVILDLRANAGGQLGDFRRITAEFLPPGTSLGKSVQRVFTIPAVTPTSLHANNRPLAVLIGPRTRSAAEMFAEVMRHYRRAIIVGDRSAGAALTARYFSLPDGGRLTVATGDYIAPSGARIEGKGVEPDVPAAETLEAIRSGRDGVIDAAETALLDARK